MAADREQLRQVWGRFATGVTVITTRDASNQVHGMTANALCSITLEPPLALLSVAHQRITYALVKEQRAFGINILTQEQQEAAAYYAQEAKETPPPKEVNFWFTQRGTALLQGCLAYLDCRVVAEHPTGDHTLFIAQAEEVILGEGRPLLFYESTYAQLQDTPSPFAREGKGEHPRQGRPEP